MAFVVDNSVSMAWCFKDETTLYSEQILQRLQVEEALVPSIWPLEVINVLLTAERRNRITTAQADAFLEVLSELPINVEEIGWPQKTTALLLRGRSTGLTAYDSAYLDLALRAGCPLATQDNKILDAAAHLKVTLL